MCSAFILFSISIIFCSSSALFVFELSFSYVSVKLILNYLLCLHMVLSFVYIEIFVNITGSHYGISISLSVYKYAIVTTFLDLIFLYKIEMFCNYKPLPAIFMLTTSLFCHQAEFLYIISKWKFGQLLK